MLPLVVVEDDAVLETTTVHRVVNDLISMRTVSECLAHLSPLQYFEYRYYSGAAYLSCGPV